MADVKYHSFFRDIAGKKIDCNASGDVFKMSLHTVTHTPNQDHEVYASLDNEVANGNGYTTGGFAFTNTNNALSDDDTNNKMVFDITQDAVWAASTIIARYAVLYDDTPVSPADPLLGLFDFVTDKSTTNGTFTVQFNASGIIEIA